MNRFGEKYEIACKEGLVWACLIHWTINMIVGKTILLFNKVHSQMKMGTNQMYMACVLWISRMKQ
jgi:hypothetical protein